MKTILRYDLFIGQFVLSHMKSPAKNLYQLAAFMKHLGTLEGRDGSHDSHGKHKESTH